MGNDGGSIPKRRELVKEAARDPTTAQLKETQQEKQEYLWTTDPLSNKPLQPPIVSDCTGKLYNKDSILEYLLGTVDDAKKSEYDKILDGNVKSLKDVVEVHFEADNSTSDEGRTTNGNGSTLHWKCPITSKPLGAGQSQKAVYLVPCGHAFSATAIKELAEDRCQKCDSVFAPNDAIPIIPTTGEDIARLTLRMETLREKGLTHALKKASGGNKKRKKNVEAESAGNMEKVRSANGSTSSGIKNSATASLTAKVLAEQEERSKKRKTERSANVSSLFSNNDPSKPGGKSSDFMTRGYIIPADARR